MNKRIEEEQELNAKNKTKKKKRKKWELNILYIHFPHLFNSLCQEEKTNKRRNRLLMLKLRRKREKSEHER